MKKYANNTYYIRGNQCIVVVTYLKTIELGSGFDQRNFYRKKSAPNMRRLRDSFTFSPLRWAK